MLKDLRSGEFVRLSVADAELLSLLDGTRSLAELVAEAARRQGADGPARLALLLAGLGGARAAVGDLGCVAGLRLAGGGGCWRRGRSRGRVRARCSRASTRPVGGCC